MRNLPPKHTTKNLAELHAEFLEECKYAGKLRPETLRGYGACLRLLIKFRPDITVEDLCPETMLAFFKWLETRPRIVGNKHSVTGVKNSTVATYRNKLNKFFKWLQTRGSLKQDPFNGVPYPNVVYSDRKYIHGEDVEKIFVALAFTIDWSNDLVKRRNIAIYSVLLYCGLRKNEMILLKLIDIDFGRGELRVRAENSKSKRDRYIPLNSKVTVALKEYLKERNLRGYKTPYLWVSDNKDQRFTINGFKHLNRKVELASGVDFHPHQFRHTFAVNLLVKGCDVYKVKQLLGHSDIRMTEDYLRCLPTQAMQADVEKISLESLV